MLQVFNYNDIIQNFDQNWDFGYLKYEDIIEVLNQPIKYNKNLIQEYNEKEYPFSFNDIFLIGVNHNYDYDYGHISNFTDICTKLIPELEFEYIICDLKYAAVKAGLGQYAKNNLFYHYKFGFDCHLCCVFIKNPIINLPKQKNANFNLLSLCENCYDCYMACPVKAIQFNHNRTWIDLYKCDHFCYFGNHPIIPSLKWGEFKVLFDGEITDNIFEDIYNLSTEQQKLDFLQKYQIEEKYRIFRKKYYFHYPICRECTSQKKCSNYNGNYPYDKVQIEFKGIRSDI